MVVDVALYTLVHQPRRLKLPAQPVPHCASIEDLTHCLFDERLNKYCFHQVAQSSYYPAAHMLLDVVRQQGLRLALGFSLSFVRQAERWEPALLDLFRELVAEEGVELVGVDPYHSLHCLIDLPGFAIRMRWMADELAAIFGKRPTVTDTTAMCMSAGIYDALDSAGFRGAFVESSAQVMQWRSSTYLYRYYDEQPCTTEMKVPARARRNTSNDISPYLLAPHQDLSADVGLRFSRRSWSDYPLYADTYARWIARTEGDFVLLNWDFEVLGGRHADSSGIFDFMRALPGELERHGVASYTPTELIERHAFTRTHHLPLPVHPPAWSNMLGLDNAVGDGPQQELFQVMRDVYDRARLTENPALLDLALWLMQSDHFKYDQEYDPRRAGSFSWSYPAASDVLRERKQVCYNALHAFEPYLPARVMRQSGHKPAAKGTRTRRKNTVEQQEALAAVDGH